MGLFRPLAALLALVTAPFHRAPAKKRIDVPLRDLPSRGHIGTRARGRYRRAQVARSFTRFLAHKPMGVGPEAAAWRKGLQQWRDGWAAARANSTTVRRGAAW